MSPARLQSSLDEILCRRLPRNDGPGVQVILVSQHDDGGGVLYEGARGLANPIANPKDAPLTTSHRANLYSMSKFFTACCILRLMETGTLRQTSRVRDHVPEEIRRHIPDGCTVRQLLTHTGGAPNPLPLSWVHTPDEAVDEARLLGDVLGRNPFSRGQGPFPYRYSNVGYWILGMVVTAACGAPPSDFARCCRGMLFAGGCDAGKASLSKEEGESLVSDRLESFGSAAGAGARFQYGHVRRRSALALAARLFCPAWCTGPTDRSWMRMEPHLVDGVSYGGLVGSTRSVSDFLRRLLAGEVLSEKSAETLFRPATEGGRMTLGLHVRPHRGLPIYHKEGGGAGCHSSLQIRPDDGVAAVCVAGSASFDVNGLLDEMLDRAVQERNLTDRIDPVARKVGAKDGTELHTRAFASPTKEGSASNLMEGTVLLIHGGPGVPDYLQDLASLLIRSSIAPSVVSFDQRGVGLSRRPPSEPACRINMRLMLDDLDSIMDAYELDRVHVLGHSWGGVLARLYGQTRPERIASMVLLSPTAVTEAPEWPEMEARVLRFNVNKAGTMAAIKLGLWSLLMLVPIPSVSDYAGRNMLRYAMKNYYYDPATAPDPPQSFLNGVSTRAMVSMKHAFLEYAKEPMELQWDDIPSLATFGEGDIYGKYLVDKFRSRWGGRFAIIAGSSHLAWIDQPKHLVGILEKFYGSLL